MVIRIARKSRHPGCGWIPAHPHAPFATLGEVRIPQPFLRELPS
jgi:hypothetical protein